MDWTRYRALLKRAHDAERDLDELRQLFSESGGDMLRAYRESLNLTQRGFAEIFGVNHTYVSHIEHGRQAMSLALASQMSQRFDAIKRRPRP